MKKTSILTKIISIILCVIFIAQPTCSALAASFTGNTYVKEMIISYGDTEEQAKEWLKNKNYKIIDNNLNEGADDTFSKKRAVYIGYKTTMNADEAITDLKLMNMKGGYSVLDYQMLLEEQKTNIRNFINNFLISINEYRENYKNGQSRAIAAHDLLNMLYDDDTEQNLGDLLLEKIKEEYSSEDFEKMDKEEQAKHADMTTILMQSNASSVLAIEQLIAMATDGSDSVWMERYSKASNYDDMIDEVIEEKDVDPSKASILVASKYDDYAKLIASKIPDYLNYLKTYTESGVSLKDSQEDIKAYQDKNGNCNLSVWYTAGIQYEALNTIKAKDDDESLLDIITNEDYDLEGEDRYMLYPLVSVLTEGQKACVEFLPFYQLVSIGLNGDDATKDAMDSLKLTKEDAGSVSIYDGIDRSIYGEEVAMTSDAYHLQNSSDKDMSTNWFSDGISTTTKVLYISLGVSIGATIGSFAASTMFTNKYLKASKEFMNAGEKDMIESTYDFVGSDVENVIEEGITEEQQAANTLIENYDNTTLKLGATRSLGNAFRYVGIGFAAISIILMTISLVKTYQELKKYYNVEFTPIPMHMVNQGINEKNEKVFTYYTAVKCNRQEAKMITDQTKILKGFGDINGDVGKQWVALYTTTDKTAGDPITTDFVVQYANSDIPNDSTPLSMFGEMVAQNLTNSKAGYTYDNSKKGIYLFYGTDKSVFAGSAVSTGVYALIAGGSMIVFAVASFFITKKIKSKKEKENA